MHDAAEFNAMFPKLGHRLHLKRIVKGIEDGNLVPKAKDTEIAVKTTASRLSGITEVQANLVS